MKKTIRQYLEEITESVAINEGQKIEKVCAFGIKRVTEPNGWQYRRYPNLCINCFAYAFGLGESDSYRECAYDDALKEQNRQFANSNFVKFLLKHSVIYSTDSVSTGDVIIYCDKEGQPKHAGIVSNLSDTIRSKWGTLSIFEHEKWQVPESYGAQVKYYKPLALEIVEEKFFQWVEKQIGP
ncbi:MAG: hypothetical protein HYU99_08410 [Deltaproteobacteria bacterium]|nr:hypothetical protein [Deltaproteobacteria bacterium]